MLKRAHDNLEDEVAFLIEKINYLLRKVEIYDKALNEFNQIKLTIDEAAEHTRHSKDLVREAKDLSNTNSTDISTLVKLISTLTDRFDSKFVYLKDKLLVLGDRVTNHKEELDLKREDFREEIYGDLRCYLTLMDGSDIRNEIKANQKSCESMISNINNNLFNIDNTLLDLKKIVDAHKETHIAMQKDLCRFQNALVRKGVPIDIQ